MKTKTLNTTVIWKQCEDLVIPQLRLDLVERAVYYHLLRHSRLEGKRQLRFSIDWLARGACLSTSTVRKGVRSLIAKGAMHLSERSKVGHLVEVRLPDEIPGVRAGERVPNGATTAVEEDLEEKDFLETSALREAIHAREGGSCFYCLSRLSPTTRCLDHVVAQVHRGGNCYRNLVSACSECNSLKGERRADEFLRWLFRQGRIDSSELTARLRSLKSLASGRLRPTVSNV